MPPSAAHLPLLQPPETTQTKKHAKTTLVCLPPFTRSDKISATSPAIRDDLRRKVVQT